MWDKVKYSLIHVAQKYADSHEFFLKADDDTYMIMENLEKILERMNSSEPFIMGRHFRVSLVAPILLTALKLVKIIMVIL